MSTQQTGTATLVVENFSRLKTRMEIMFSFVGNCYFGIHPKFDVPSIPTDNVYVYWHNFTIIRANVHFNVSILNANREKLYTKEYNWELDSSSYGNRPVVAFISRAKLLDPKNGYLVNDKLTLLCEAETIDHDDNESKVLDSSLRDWKNLSEDFQSLLIDGKFCDATLTVGADGKQFNVHKAIIAARSPVFAAMFEHDCEEKRQNEVKITDITAEVCNELVRYIYTGKVESLDQYAMDLLEAADKYQVNSLKTLCEQYLSSSLTIETAANVLIFADLYRASELKACCLDFIAANPDKMKDTEGWKVLSWQRILESGDFSDFAFIIGKKELKVHKNILSARSPVFKAMFSTDLEEKIQNRVEITDIDLEVFEQLLCYIYSGVIPNLNDYALELFVASDKYQLAELKSLCSKTLSSILTTETVVKILILSDMHSDGELKLSCIKFITANSIKVMQTDGWKQMVKTRVELMVELYQELAIFAHSDR